MINFLSIQLSGSNQQKVFLSRPFGNLGIGISRHYHIVIGIGIGIGITKNLLLPSESFFKKIEYFYSFLCLVIASVPLCYKYLFLYDFLFVHPKVSIGVLEKGNFNFQKHPSIGVLKKQLLRKFLHTLHSFHRNIQCAVLFKYTCSPSCDFSKKLFRAAIL